MACAWAKEPSASEAIPKENADHSKHPALPNGSDGEREGNGPDCGDWISSLDFLVLLCQDKRTTKYHQVHDEPLIIVISLHSPSGKILFKFIFKVLHGIPHRKGYPTAMGAE